MKKLSEPELCDLVRVEHGETQRARAAYAELYTRSYDMAMAYAYKLFGDRDRAEDAVSEAYAKTLQALRRDLGPRDSFRSYLLTAVRTETLRSSAMDRITDVIDVDEFEEKYSQTAPDTVEGVAERDQLVRAFTSLPEARQQLLYLVDVEDQEPAQVADRLGVKLRAMNSQLFRAREDLRSAYLQQYAEQAPSECRGVVPLLGRFVRGGLRNRNSAGVTRHLEVCGQCQEQLDRLQRINSNLRAWIGPIGIGLGAAAGATAAGTGSAGAAAVALDGVKSSLLVKYALPLKWAAGVAGAGVVVAGGAALMWPKVDPVPEPAPVVVTPSPEVVPSPSPEPVPEEPAVEEPLVEEPVVEAPPVESDETKDWVEVD